MQMSNFMSKFTDKNTGKATVSFQYMIPSKVTFEEGAELPEVTYSELKSYDLSDCKEYAEKVIEETAGETTVFECRSIDHDYYVMAHTCTTVVGAKWPVTESLYYHMMDLMPPIRSGHNWFIMSEAQTGNIHSKFYFDGTNHWHEYVDVTKHA